MKKSVGAYCIRPTLTALILICTAAFGQTEKYLAVSVSGEPDITKANQLSGKIIRLATESDLFSVLPSEMEFQQEVVKARKGGVVNDETLETLAKNANANYLCIAKINTLFDGKKEIVLNLFDLKLNSKEPMQYISNGETDDPITLENSTQFNKEIEKATKKMLDGFKRKTKPQEPEAPNITPTPIYQNFTKAERLGTFALNHALGLGSYMIMDNGSGAAWILGFGVVGGLFYYGSRANMSGVREDDRAFLKYSLIGIGFAFFGGAEIMNLYQSFGYDKPQTTSLDTHRNFNLAILPTRNGNGMAYGLMYNRRF